MTLDDYLEAHRKSLKDVRQQIESLERTATTLMYNINHIKKIQLKQELEGKCTKPTQE
ncbi:hypothetical protein PP749_gp023 [Rhizobium phage RHEph22]|uniref:Uncharacterized protein n=1 Tax=Rhizobium phage RHEph22 TaxID=2836135 RepID=A0AAE7VMZ9_9CAUD|nr:hypothetical protein PP749_gp023 [Rhizobium phage RHEph22]QXV74696.1 hypothetical protein [Rhizobium phage RHEph22]QXV74791.1 hypothetical protein [Rhizobium phage RHEph24]